MPWLDVIWNYDDPKGNVAHIAEHGLTPDDVNAALMDPVEEEVSRTSGLPLVRGFTPDGRYIVVVYEQVDEISVYPATAFEIEE